MAPKNRYVLCNQSLSRSSFYYSIKFLLRIGYNQGAQFQGSLAAKRGLVNTGEQSPGRAQCVAGR